MTAPDLLQSDTGARLRALAAEARTRIGARVPQVLRAIGAVHVHSTARAQTWSCRGCGGTYDRAHGRWIDCQLVVPGEPPADGSANLTCACLGDGGGDVIALVRARLGLDFRNACSWLIVLADQLDAASAALEAGQGDLFSGGRP